MSITVGGVMTGLCSDLCTPGADDACTDLGLDDALCLGDTANEGFGDLGRCLQLCDCAMDCRFSSLSCVELPAPVKGRAGYCSAPQQGDVTITSCP